MQWSRSDTLVLAAPRCTLCHGLGLRFGRRVKVVPCACVTRAIFRACYARFRFCSERDKQMSRCTLGALPGPRGRLAWGRQNEEYCADFILVSRRALEPELLRVFRFHFLLAADWRLCCEWLHVDRGYFFHLVYALEQKLGRAFRETEPYALYPVDEYFGGVRVEETPASTARLPVAGGLRPPVKRVA